MTTHVRKQIRDAAVTLLTGLTTTAGRVSASRQRPRHDADLPCLLIKTEDEAIDAATFQDLQERNLDLVITGMVKDTGAIDDTLDAICYEVETAIAGSPTISGKAHGSLLKSIRTQFDDTLDQPVGEIELTYTVSYFTHASTPGTLA